MSNDAQNMTVAGWRRKWQREKVPTYQRIGAGTCGAGFLAYGIGSANMMAVGAAILVIATSYGLWLDILDTPASTWRKVFSWRTLWFCACLAGFGALGVGIAWWAVP